MIISIAATSNGIEKSIFACNLAAQRTRAGHRTLLIDGDSQKSTMLWSTERCDAGIRPQQPTRAVTAKGLLPELENLLPRYKDIVIDAETRDCLASRSALVAARKLVVLVQHRDFDTGRQEAIFKQIDAARLCNPGLQVRFVIIADAGDVPEQSVTAVRAVVARIPAASLSSTIIHPTPALRDAFSTGMSIPEFFCSDDIAQKEMEKLYREVFEH